MHQLLFREGVAVHWKWSVLSVTGFAFFFVTATTFTSLAVLLYVMSADLHWSQADAGLSFSLLALACGISSPLPAVCIRWIGVRATMPLGGVLLAIGFALAGRTNSLTEFFVALCFMGTAFSLLAPVPGIFLIPRWFADTAPRVIGFYFMAGAFGGVIGPVMVNTSVALTGSWRAHWYAMAVVALALAALCALLARDRPDADAGLTGGADVAAAMEADVPAPAAAGLGAWSVRQASASRLFLATALAMLIIQTAITIINSTLVPHVIHLGGSRSVAALALGLASLTGTAAKGVGGIIAQRGLHPRLLLLFSLVTDSVAMALLGVTHSVPVAFVAAALFGTGWGIGWLAAHLLLLRRFGPAVTPDLVALATGLTTGAIIGPTAAGFIFVRTGSFAPIYMAAAGLLLVALLVTLLTNQDAVEQATQRHGGEAEGFAPGLQ